MSSAVHQLESAFSGLIGCKKTTLAPQVDPVPAPEGSFLFFQHELAAGITRAYKEFRITSIGYASAFEHPGFRLTMEPDDGRFKRHY